VGGADHHHRRQHDPLLYILFSADGRTTSSSLYISLKFPWKYISLKFLWKIPDSCRISTLLIVVWLLSIIVVWLLSSLFSPDMQPSLASGCANEIQISSVLLCLLFMTSCDWCSSSLVISEEEEFLLLKAAAFVVVFRSSSSRQQQVILYYIIFIPINLYNPKWSIKPFFRFVYKLVGGIANTLRGSWLSPLSSTSIYTIWNVIIALLSIEHFRATYCAPFVRRWALHLSRSDCTSLSLCRRAEDFCPSLYSGVSRGIWTKIPMKTLGFGFCFLLRHLSLAATHCGGCCQQWLLLCDRLHRGALLCAHPTFDH